MFSLNFVKQSTMKTYNPDESLSEYKVRVIDSISESYCAAKWYNATIWLGHGQTTSCHHPPAHKIDPEEIKFNPSAIHNTQHKKMMRKLMQEGKRPNECEYCWKVEDIGKDLISDRVMKTHIYKEEDIKTTVEMPWEQDVMLKILEVSFDRTCNFACSYCNPSFSTSWVKDIKKHGPYRNIISDSRGHYVDDAPWAASALDKEGNNPYIQAFWKWWESGLQDNLEEIRITGGEPLMAASVWKLFDWFKNNPEKGKKLRYAVNSNLVPKQDLLDKFIEVSHHVPHLDLYTSNESLGAHSEYIRDGMDYKQWKINLERVIVEGNFKSIVVMMTINGLCLSSITEFMDEMLAFKRKYGNRYCQISLNILRFPSFQSPAILPINIKEFYRNKLQKWYDDRKSNHLTDRDCNYQPLLGEWEYAQVERLIDYLDIIKTPHSHTAEESKLWNDFKNFYLQYDVRRGKDFKKTFPEFAHFIDNIDVAVPTNDEILTNQYVDSKICSRSGDPATMESGYISDELKG